MATTFGLDQISKETPASAVWAFRGWFIISKAFLGWAGAIGIFNLHEVFIIGTTVSLLGDPIALFLSKMFGCTPEEVGATVDKSPAEESNDLQQNLTA